MQITRERYKYEVDTFVCNFLLLVVAVGLSVTSVFTMMSDEFLGTTQSMKMYLLMPQVIGSSTVFVLQLVLMIGVHALTDKNNYATKSNIVLGVALMQFLCVVHNYMDFTKLLPDLDSLVLRQIDYFYWVLAYGLGIWLLVGMASYLYKVRISRKFETT